MPVRFPFWSKTMYKADDGTHTCRIYSSFFCTCPTKEPKVIIEALLLFFRNLVGVCVVFSLGGRKRRSVCIEGRERFDRFWGPKRRDRLCASAVQVSFGSLRVGGHGWGGGGGGGLLGEDWEGRAGRGSASPPVNGPASAAFLVVSSLKTLELMGDGWGDPFPSMDPTAV